MDLLQAKRKTHKHLLTTTNQVVYLLPWKAKAPKPWLNQHEQVLIPDTPSNHIQIVRKNKLRPV